MNGKKLMISAGAALLLLAAPATAAAGDAFAGVLEPYEAVRRALVADDQAAVTAPAAELHEAIRHLQHHLTSQAAGVPVEKLADVRALVPELDRAAAALVAAGDLKAARDAFYALSKPLVRWRQARGNGPAVVYCSMQKRSWLQPTPETIGNPYYGQEMATCGKVVSS
jgi:hypothetical protein